MNIIEQRIKEIRERLEKATPGKWISAIGMIFWRFKPYFICSMECEVAVAHELPVDQIKNISSIDDAIFIAAARQDIPFLLEELEKRERALGVAIEAMKDIRSECTSLNNSPDYCIDRVCESLTEIEAILAGEKKVGEE